MFSYIRYLRIDYPQKVKLLFDAQSEELISLSVDVDFPSDIERSLTKQPLPAVFEQYDVHSSFLYNFWDPLITFSVIVFSKLGMRYMSHARIIRALHWHLFLQTQLQKTQGLHQQNSKVSEILN